MILIRYSAHVCFIRTACVRGSLNVRRQESVRSLRGRQQVRYICRLRCFAASQMQKLPSEESKAGAITNLSFSAAEVHT